MKLKVVGTLEDRSQLSHKMADLCEKLPIYVVVEGELEPTAYEKGDRKTKVKRLGLSVKS